MLLNITEEFDVGTTGTVFADICMLGFWKGHQCAEFVRQVRIP